MTLYHLRKLEQLDGEVVMDERSQADTKFNRKDVKETPMIRQNRKLYSETFVSTSPKSNGLNSSGLRYGFT